MVMKKKMQKNAVDSNVENTVSLVTKPQNRRAPMWMSEKHKVYKLNKALYGLKQAP